MTSQEAAETMCMRCCLFSLELGKSIMYKRLQPVDFLNFKEILGQFNRFLEGTFHLNKY